MADVNNTTPNSNPPSPLGTSLTWSPLVSTGLGSTFYTSNNMLSNKGSVVIQDGSISTGTNEPTGKLGNIQFTSDGNIMAHDGTDWVLLCGIGEKNQIEKIKDVLREFWPEVLFDLMMKDLI